MAVVARASEEREQHQEPKSRMAVLVPFHGDSAVPHGVPVCRTWYRNVGSHGMNVAHPSAIATNMRTAARRRSPRTATNTRDDTATVISANAQ